MRVVEWSAIAGALALVSLMAWQSLAFLELLRFPASAVPDAAVSSSTTSRSIEALFGAGDDAFASLPGVVLRASFVHPDPALSSAILVAADRPGRLVRVGEEVLPGVQLAAVSTDHVVLAQGGARLSLALHPATSP